MIPEMNTLTHGFRITKVVLEKLNLCVTLLKA